MISRPTVFVLGAGASMPYGFPSGADLLDKARDPASNVLSRDTGSHYEKHQIDAFRQLVSEAQTESLDALLEFRKDYQKIGKHFIAAVLLRNELSSLKSRGESDPWISYLISRMLEGCSGPDEFKTKNKVTFVTFNYDRLIEQRLHLGLRSQYGINDKGCAEVMSCFPVVHLHGSLGKYFDTPENSIPFGLRLLDHTRNEWLPFDQVAPRYVERAAREIQIVHEANPTSNEFVQARAALKLAERVFFLGFGFGTTNVERLGMANIDSKAIVFATVWRRTQQEFNVYVQRPISLASSCAFGNTLQPEWNCKRLLLECVNHIVT